VVTICTASLTFNNSTICPHSDFRCFVWIWKQTIFYFTIQNQLNGFNNCDLNNFSQVVTICTIISTKNICMYFPHSVLMCFVSISEQTALISQYSSNWLSCITKADGVFFEVQIIYLNKFACDLPLKVIIGIGIRVQGRNVHFKYNKINKSHESQISQFEYFVFWTWQQEDVSINMIVWRYFFLAFITKYETFYCKSVNLFI
jgi:hypothetical protein